jgi:menaquinone-9 beta-reductase
VDARFGCEASGLERASGGWVVETGAGEIRAHVVVGADGLHSRVARWVGWARPPRRPHRYAFVGHAGSRGHGLDRVLVTVLDSCEVYTAPTSPDELLVAVLGSKSGLRTDGESVREAYARHVRDAHPELSVEGSEVRGAGPFWVRPSTVAGRGVFLIGDAGGFLDPLTGDGMSDALVAASRLAGILGSKDPGPEAAYRRWEAGKWRRRAFVSRLALLLTGSSVLAGRALRRLQRRPVTLNRLLEVNDGSRSLWSLTVRDWAALAGV